MSSSAVFLGVHGEVIALDRTTGQEVWHVKLTGGDFVNLLLDQDRVIATTKGEVYCVDAATGQLLWHNNLPGLGWGLITIATATGSTFSWAVVPEETPGRGRDGRRSSPVVERRAARPAGA